MKTLVIGFSSLLILCTPLSAKAQTYKKPTNKVLAISGGGARGAWGLGVVEQLVKQEGGYRAVFGTSTGSLMAPMVLLQQFDKLETQYTQVTQKKIFNKNPFRVKQIKGKPGAPDTLKTELRAFNAAWRLLRGKPTLGESLNMKDLIRTCFTQQDFDSLKALQKIDGLNLSVAVTNLTSGQGEIKSSENITSWDEMVTWIWASANTPIFMSEVTIFDNVYVDGGLREIVPLRAAVKYAIAHHIDTVDVIINDSRQALDTKWNINDKKNKGYFNGLLRVLAIYNSNTEYYNIWSGEKMTELFDARELLHQDSIRHLGAKLPTANSRLLTITIYSMPYGLSRTYPDDLGFDSIKMKVLLDSGTNFIKNRTYDVNTRQRYQASKQK